MMGIDYFYSASVMGYGFGRPWHKKYKFPNFPRVTKTLTCLPKNGNPYLIIPIPFKNSVWNKVALHNIGFYEWFKHYRELDKTNIIISLAGFTHELISMMYDLDYSFSSIGGVEINFSCPNVTSFCENKKSLGHVISKVKYPVYLKLRYNQNPYEFDLNNVAGIRLNSVPFLGGGVSGKMAQKKNWEFIKTYAKDLNVAGCSFTSMDDIKRLEDMGCREIGIGSTIITNPQLIENLKEDN